MLYLLLSGILLIFSIAFYKLFKNDIGSPTVLSCLIYALSSFGAFLAQKKDSWNFQELHLNTFFIIILGILFFGIGEFLARKLIFKNKKEKINKGDYIYNKIRIKPEKLIFCFLFILLTIILIYLNMKKIINVSGLINLINSYRMASEIFNENALAEGIKINTIVMQMFHACEILSLCFIYVVTKNFFAKDKIKNNLIYIIMIIMCLFSTFLLGGRSGFIRFVVEVFMMWFLLYSRKNTMNIKKFFFVSLKIIIIVLPLFYFILPLLGRNSTTNMYDYLTFYIGCPIPSLDIMLQSEAIKPEYFGQYTLKGIQLLMSKIGLMSDFSQYSSNWISFAPGLASNVFTSMYSPLVDFGIKGLLICQFLFGFIFSKMYIWAKKYMNYKYLLFYIFTVNLIFDQFRTEKLFGVFIHYNTIIYLVMLLIITWFLFGKKILENGEI